MSNAGWLLQKALYSALLADSELIALLGGNHVYDDVPQGAPFPYVTIGESSVSDWSTGSDDGYEHILTLHVWSRAKGRKQVYDIVNCIRQVLDQSPLTVTGHHLVNMRFELSEARRESDGETYHGIVRYRAVTEVAV